MRIFLDMVFVVLAALNFVSGCLIMLIMKKLHANRAQKFLGYEAAWWT